MRLAPVPMAFHRDAARAIDLAGDSSRTTHAAAVTVDACRYFGGLLVSAIAGATKDELLSPRHSPCGGIWSQHPLHAEIDEVAAGSFLRREPPEINGSGYVVRTLEAALWAFSRTASFRDGCLAAANLGQDADTVAAVFGQIAGAVYGEDGIPEDWRRKLARRELIEDYAERLFKLSGVIPGNGRSALTSAPNVASILP